MITKDGSNMTINYGTSPFKESQDHTGAQVSIAAQGPHAENFIGLIDQTEIFGIINTALFGNSTGN
ncbi:MAG: alkaline phosphatase [Candidatus Nitrosocosmicus sp.]|nr:alkaline phosphatase [Candidatus Nitrosocosmicus sp.]